MINSNLKQQVAQFRKLFKLSFTPVYSCQFQGLLFSILFITALVRSSSPNSIDYGRHLYFLPSALSSLWSYLHTDVKSPHSSIILIINPHNTLLPHNYHTLQPDVQSSPKPDVNTVPNCVTHTTFLDQDHVQPLVTFVGEDKTYL